MEKLKQQINAKLQIFLLTCEYLFIAHFFCDELKDAFSKMGYESKSKKLSQVLWFILCTTDNKKKLSLKYNQKHIL